MTTTFLRKPSNLAVIIVLAILIIAVAIMLRPKPASGVPETSPAAQAIVDQPATLIPQDAPIEGPFASKVTLVEFLDYECPGCQAYHSVLKTIRSEYAGRIRFVVRQFPLVEIHRNAKGAAIASVCAQRQGKFFEFSDLLFDRQNALARRNLEAAAEEVGLDLVAFNACLDDAEAEATVIRDRKHGEALGVRGTPTLFLNGTLVPNLPNEAGLRALIDTELAK